MTARPLTATLLEDRLTPSALGIDELPAVPIITEGTLANITEIFQRGLAAGNRADTFTLIGDSFSVGAASTNNVTPASLAAHPELLDGYALYANGANPFGRVPLTANGGSVLSQGLATLPAEVAAARPSAAFVQFGTNDAPFYRNPELFRDQLGTLTLTLINYGVIPVLTTIPYTRVSHIPDPLVEQHNRIILNVADDLNVPVWNYGAAMRSLPLMGLSQDGVHPSVSPNGGGAFTPADLQFGYNLRNFQMIQILDKLKGLLLDGAAADFAVTPTGWLSLADSPRVAAVGLDAGASPVVRMTDPLIGAVLSQFYAYEPTFTGGVRVAMGDVTGDGVADVVTAPGAGRLTDVRVFDGRDGSVVFSTAAYAASFQGGVSVAVGDFTGDGVGDVAVGAGDGGGPHVRVLRGGDFAEAASFFAMDVHYRGGVRVGVGDFTGDGRDDLAVGPGRLGGPRVNLFDGVDFSRIGDFFAHDPNRRGGLHSAALDVNGDGRDELLSAVGSGESRLNIHDVATGELLATLMVDSAVRPGGVSVAAGRVDDDSVADIVITAGAGPDGSVRAFSGIDLRPLSAFPILDGAFPFGGVVALTPPVGTAPRPGGS